MFIFSMASSFSRKGTVAFGTLLPGRIFSRSHPADLCTA